ncbi:MAG: MBL fold metallo-hydrolase, partial [Bacteroidales bacterium]|nr:MBL fold metallo-hydrolase [Bacteroidales bacterium]
MKPTVTPFFDTATYTYSYVVADPATGQCALVDSVLDYDPAAGRTRRTSADRLIDFVRREGLKVQWLLETHVHADHLSAAPYLKKKLGGTLAIGEHITVVQETFARLFNTGAEFAA